MSVILFIIMKSAWHWDLDLGNRSYEGSGRNHSVAFLDKLQEQKCWDFLSKVYALSFHLFLFFFIYLPFSYLFFLIISFSGPTPFWWDEMFKFDGQSYLHLVVVMASTKHMTISVLEHEK